MQSFVVNVQKITTVPYNPLQRGAVTTHSPPTLRFNHQACSRVLSQAKTHTHTHKQTEFITGSPKKTGLSQQPVSKTTTPRSILVILDELVFAFSFYYSYLFSKCNDGSAVVCKCFVLAPLCCYSLFTYTSLRSLSLSPLLQNLTDYHYVTTAEHTLRYHLLCCIFER